MAAALLGMAAMAEADRLSAAETPVDTIRGALERWRDAFNARRADGICDLFAQDLRYDFQGLPEQDHGLLCGRLRRALADRTQSYHYDLSIKEIIVSGDLAVVRLTWTSTFTGSDGRQAIEDEPGLDVFRRQADGSWRIIRYIAYPARP